MALIKSISGIGGKIGGITGIVRTASQISGERGHFTYINTIVMRSYFRLLFVALSLFAGGKASAQLVGTDCFLQGRYVEVGINQMGGFGACTSPMTYHPHVCCGTATAFTPGGNLDAVVDWGHDGWSVGSP